MARKFDTSVPTNSKLVLPRALADGVLLSGLTAPAMRAALVLVGYAGDSGRIDMLKPELERLAGVRIDNGQKFVDRIQQSAIDVPESDEVEIGEPVFDDLTYTPGTEKRLAGIVRGQLSGSFRTAIGRMSRTGMVTLDIDVLRHLDTTAGILIYLRIALERAANPGKSVLKMRLRDVDAFGWFGQYCRQASTGRVNVGGDVFRSVSLGRIHRHLIAPGILDLAAAVDDFEVDAVTAVPEQAVRGRAWSHVDVLVRKLITAPTVAQMAQLMSEKERHRSDIAKTA
ncbi:MAG: hypothetical protein ACOH2M_18615 [Cypionkella sp.]